MTPDAYVFINTLIGDEKKVFNKVKKLESVEEVYLLYGLYDVLAKVHGKTREDLKGQISNLRNIKGLRSTLTYESL